MMNTIIRPNLFELYDRSGIIRYLKKKAAKGWLLCDIGSLYWKFRRIEPQELNFSIIYDRKRDSFDFRTDDRRQGYIDMGGEAGWNLAAASPQVMVFWTDRHDAVPMETDPVTELNTIRELMRKTFTGTAAVLAVLVFLRLLRYGPYMRVLFLDMLADSSFISGCAILLLLFIAAAAEWIMYLAWRRKALRAAETGTFVETPPTRVLTTLFAVLIAAFFICAMLPIIKLSPKNALAVLIPTIIIVAGMRAAMSLAIKILKKKDFSGTKNRLITAASGFVAGMILFSLFVHFSSRLPLPPVQEPEPDLPIEIKMAGIPGVFADGAETSQSASSTVILEYHIVRQGPWDENGSDPWMNYRITKVKTALFRKAIMNKVLKQFGGTEGVAENSSFWDADEARQIQYVYGNTHSYMLTYGNYILDIDFNWEPTPEQKAYIGQIMRGIASGQ